MNRSTLVRRNLAFHLRAHLGVLIGAAIGSAALIGALVVGDSVRMSLEEMALGRLGKTELAMATGDRFFRANLAGELQAQMPPDLDIRFTSLIQIQGTANSVQSDARANHVQVLGIQPDFWEFSNHTVTNPPSPAGGVLLNEPLARQLQAKAGDTVLLRVLKPSMLSRDSAISPQDDLAVAMRVTVNGVLSAAELGQFSLQANQVAPYTAFFDIGFLQEKIGLAGRANLMLVSGPIETESAAIFLEQTWKLADAELELLPVNGGRQIELRSPRVFLDAAKVTAAETAAPGARPILTYFANELRHGTNSTPYSMITAMGPPVVPDGMADDEIILNDWLADDLSAKPGDRVSFRYFLLDAGRSLQERTNTFRVHSIVPLAGEAGDRDLMPAFPGVADAESTRDWEAGFELETDRIRPKDEQYWKEHRGTPKAFITLAAGEKLWANRFGEITALRWPAADRPTNELAAAILKNLDPASVGLGFQPVRELALTASSSGIGRYFGGLFIGFSMFLIGAALLLMALLFQFGVEQRSPEIGTLLAVGFQPKEVRKLLLREGVVLGLLGGMIGAFGGIAYARAMVAGLTTIWSDAVASASLSYHVTGLTLVSGIFGATFVSALTIWFTLRKQAGQPARELLNEGAEAAGQRFDSSTGKWAAMVAVVLLLAALAMMGAGFSKGLNRAAGDFFGVGALVLISGLIFIRVWFARLNRASARSRVQLTQPKLALRNAMRRSKRSVATVALLASGTFIVVAIAAFRLDATSDATSRSSGAGGFALIGETALPVTQDLNTEKGRDFFGLNPRTLENVSFVPFRMRAGDEASCLNLNKAQNPQVLGVNPAQLDSRNAFTFAGLAEESDPTHPWLSLSGSGDLPADEVACIGDMNSLMYALEVGVGDAIEMTDESGRPFKLRIVGAVKNSILQGNLIIDEAAFIKRFPGESGYRMFLIDAPSDKLPDVTSALARNLSDIGIELTPAVERMNKFNAVQNTYLSTFQVLGGLGLLLGSAGLGIVVLRNVLERRGELGLLLAIGFRRGELQRLVLIEHGLLLALGLGLGVATAAIAVLPALLSPGGGDLPWRTLAPTLLGVLLNGVLWTWIATKLALSGRLLAALRNE